MSQDRDAKMNDDDPRNDDPRSDEPSRAPPPAEPPPRGPRVRTLLTVALVIGVVFWLGSALGTRFASGFSTVWRSVFGTDTEETSGESKDYYTCGMHPWVILPRPGDCPICHMKLTPIDPSKFTGEISIDPRVVQSIGVRIEEVKTGPLVRTIRTVGAVDYDETAVRDVNIKISGWIEKLHVDYLGARVREGEPLFDLFSRELYDTQWQYLIALGARAGRSVPLLPGSAQDSTNLIDSSRTRLEYYDVSAEQIAELERAGKPSKTTTILSPHTGVVISKHANKGMLVTPGMLVYRIADLSKVWVQVTLYEYQIPFVEVGQRAVMSLTYVPGQTFEGKVIYIYPYLQKETREVQVRLEFDNPVMLLKPGMFANVELKNTLASERVLAPRSAVIDTGERQVAFVSLGDGKFEPRAVRTGVETEGGRVEILDGLTPGDMVVTSGQFLLDSESKIREALGKMIRGNLASEQKAVAAVAGVSELATLPPAVETALGRLLDAYDEIATELSGDSIAGIAAPARRVAAEIETMIGTAIPEDPHFWHQHTEAATVRGKALELPSATEASVAREKFADLSVALGKLVRATGVPPSHGKEIQELRCPMYREGQGGAIWLQGAGAVRNPYYGSAMLSCFDQRIALPTTGGHESSGDQAASETAPATRSTAPPEEGKTPTSATPGRTHGSSETPSPEPSDRDEDDRQSASTSAPEDRTERASTTPVEPIDSGPSIARSVDQLVDAYLDLAALLAADSVVDAERLIGSLGVAASAVSDRGDSDSTRQLASEVVRSLPAKSAAGDLKSLRESFKGVSSTVIALVEKTPPSLAVAPTLVEAYCPHAKASWLQTTPVITNPFYGSGMLRCGKVTRTFTQRGKE